MKKNWELFLNSQTKQSADLQMWLYINNIMVTSSTKNIRSQQNKDISLSKHIHYNKNTRSFKKGFYKTSTFLNAYA